MGPKGFYEGTKQLIFSTVKLRKSSLHREAADLPVSSLCACAVVTTAEFSPAALQQPAPAERFAVC